jgi:hypothetical protein
LRWLELTVVIVTLLALIMVLFIAARGWKHGSDRTCCILKRRNVQAATRSYQNLYGYDFGGYPTAENGTQDIAAHLSAKGYIESAAYDERKGLRKCPAGGQYSCPGPYIFPMEGKLYMECSLSASEEHSPKSHDEW